MTCVCSGPQELTIIMQALVDAGALLLAVRRDHLADKDCGPHPCAWCADLLRLMPGAAIDAARAP